MFPKLITVLFIVMWLSIPMANSSEPPLTGEEVYNGICTHCHDAGVPKAPSRNMLNFMSPGAIHHALTKGIMQTQAASLSPEEKVAVVEFITGRQLDEHSDTFAPPACEGDNATFQQSAVPKLHGWGFTPDNQREIPTASAGINRDNAKSLKLKWVFAFPDAVRARSHPAAAGGSIFVGSQSGAVYALERESGCVRWTFQARAEVRTGIVVAPWDSSDVEVDPLLYFGDFLGNVYAVHARNGALAWSARPDQHPNSTITGTPSLFDGRLYVPVSSLEVLSAIEPDYPCCSFRGSVVAYDALSGQQVWKTHTISEQPQEQGKNRAGATLYGPSGAPIWNSPSIDTKRRTLYVGTGENYSSPAGSTSDSIIAMNLDDGAIKWVFQATKNDAWNSSCVLPDRTNCPVEDGPDYDFGGATIIASRSDGQDLVLAGQKSGMVWALNPDNGKLVWSQKVGRGGIIGGIHFGMAVSENRLIVPIADALADPSFRHRYHGTPKPGVYALDIDSGDFIWEWRAEDICKGRPYCMPGNSAVPTTTPELAIAGSLDGYLRIHDATNGKILWQYNTATKYPKTISGIPGIGGALEGGSAALLDDGMLFVNSGYMFNQHMPGNVLIAFEVDESLERPSQESQ